MIARALCPKSGFFGFQHPNLHTRCSEPCAGWSSRPLQGKWDAIMELPGRGPPPGARALCPGGGYEYAVTVYHYARTLALAAKAAGVAAAGETGDFYDAYVEGAVKSLNRLQVQFMWGCLFRWKKLHSCV